MGRIEIGYHALQGVHPAYVDKLKNKEAAVRRALATLGHNTPVQWLCIDDDKRNYRFRLVASADQDDCIAQVLPLDLTLEPGQFEKLLAEGKRSCVSVVR
jgi:hypothetical protein